MYARSQAHSWSFLWRDSKASANGGRNGAARRKRTAPDMGSEIVSIHGRRVWDSRGRPTVEAEVRLAPGAIGRAIAPAGASRGSREAADLRDGGAHLGGNDVTRAVGNVNGEISDALTGRESTR